MKRTKTKFLDNLEEFKYQGEDKVAIGEFIDNRNAFEAEVDFSKDGLKECIDSLLDFEFKEKVAEKWKTVFSKNGQNEIKVFWKEEGSRQNEFMPYMMGVISFNETFQMEKIVRSLTALPDIKKWNSSVVSLDRQQMSCANNSVLFREQVSEL